MIANFLKILGACDGQIALACIAWLEARGYVVSIKGRWERPMAVCARLKISNSKFRRRLKRLQRIRPPDVQFGPKGRRLVLIRTHPEVDAYLSASAKSPSPDSITTIGKAAFQKKAAISKKEAVR